MKSSSSFFKCNHSKGVEANNLEGKAIHALVKEKDSVSTAACCEKPVSFTWCILLGYSGWWLTEFTKYQFPKECSELIVSTGTMVGCNTFSSKILLFRKASCPKKSKVIV